MRVIKFTRNGRQEPELAVLTRVEQDPQHRLYGHALIAYPVHVPDRKRSAAWLELSTLRVDWIREFLEFNNGNEIKHDRL